MSSSNEDGSPNASHQKYKGVRRRKWGKWVSEIRVPGSQERLWLGSYSTAEAAAVAHDMASYYLKEPSSIENLNFPRALPTDMRTGLSPRSIQKAASNAGLAVDAHFVVKQSSGSHYDGACSSMVPQGMESVNWQNGERQGEGLNISVDDSL